MNNQPPPTIPQPPIVTIPPAPIITVPPVPTIPPSMNTTSNNTSVNINVYENTVDKYRYIDKVPGPNNSYKHPWFCSKKTDPKQLEYIIGQFEQLFLDENQNKNLFIIKESMPEIKALIMRRFSYEKNCPDVFVVLNVLNAKSREEDDGSCDYVLSSNAIESVFDDNTVYGQVFDFFIEVMNSYNTYRLSSIEYPKLFFMNYTKSTFIIVNKQEFPNILNHMECVISKDISFWKMMFKQILMNGLILIISKIL